MTNPNWVPQEDGTHLPSEKLLNAVRANPEQFPNAVDDFAALSGKSKEEVQKILNYKSFSERIPVIGHVADKAIDIAQGASEAGNVLASKVADGAEYFGAKEYADNVRSHINKNRSDVQGIDPKFDTERGVGEVIAEGVGQAAPAITAGIASGGSLLASGTASTVAGYLTFEDEDNLVQLADEFTDDVVPDFLVINGDEDEDVKKLKGLAGHAISEFALAGAGHLVGRVWKAFKRGDPKVIEETLEATAAEAGVALDDVADVTASTVKGQKALEDIATSIKTPQHDVVKVTAEFKASAKAQNVAVVAAKEAGEEVAEHVPSRPLVTKFRNEALGALDATLTRSSSTNAGKRLEIKAFRESPTGRDVYVKQSEDVLKSLYREDYDGALDLIKNFRSENTAEYDTLWRGSVLKASLEQVESRFDDIIASIRKDPTLKTRKAWKELSSDIYDAKLKMAELYRESGSGSSYALLNRKLGITSDDTNLLKALDEAEDTLQASLKEEGYNLLSTRSEFMASKANKLDEMGINPMTVMDELDTMFKEFDDLRQGAIAAMRTNKIAQLSKAEKDALENSFIRVLHDMHSSALLGQPSTAGLEISSNLINNILLPTANIVGGKAKDIPSGIVRATREYAGYTAGFNHSWQTFKRAYAQGKSVTDDFDILDGAHASTIDYEKLAGDKSYFTYALVRLWKFAADLSIASSESQKAWRTYGMAYADGMELARKSGLKGSQAKQSALKYARGTFNENGGITDLSVKLDVQRSSWQSVIDTRYTTGKGAQVIENLRNSPSPLVSTMSRATIPFFRTLVNIGGDAGQTFMPPSFMIKALSKTRLGNHAIMSARFIDDFTGRNGQRAMVRAQARQRIGAGTFLGTMALLQSGQIQITPPSGYQSWDAKMAQWETQPPSSLIIGDTSIDLTRFLPFSAPLLYAGIYNDQLRDAQMEMKDGDYVGAVDRETLLATYGTSLGTLTTSLMSDAGSMRGVGELFEAFNKAVAEGDVRNLAKFGEGYLKQFMPAIPRVVGKNSGVIDGDWDMYRGEGFLEEVLASAGFKYGYKRLDFLGKPIQDKGRGLDPFNVKPIKTNSDPLYSEYAQLSRDSGLALQLPTPDRVFDASFWKVLGKNSSTSEWLLREEAPSLNKLKTKDGRNAYDAYRSIVYNGKASEDIKKSTSAQGDRVSIGSVVIKKGETMEAALRRYVAWEGYEDLTPDAREKVWKTIFGVFKKEAKDYISDNVEVSPDLFSDSKYGSPISQPTSISETKKGGKALAGEIQKTKGYPKSLDDIFAID